jgi:hypothetical protein
MKKEINKDLLYEFIENSTRCILDEIKTDVNFYSNSYWDDLMTANGLSRQNLPEFIKSDKVNAEHEKEIFDLLYNTIEKCDETKTQIFSGYVSADAYTRTSYLCILNLNKTYYCSYWADGDETRFVTEDPLEFTLDCIKEEESHLLIEKKGNEGGYFEDFSADLYFNF